MFPIKDELPSRRWPLVTYSLIAANIVVFLYELTLGAAGGENFSVMFGAIPALVTHRAAADFPLPPAMTLLTSMFLHAGLLHLAGNMLFLWIFGDNVEDAMGRFRFMIFYLLCGLAAAAMYIFLNPSSRVPMVGASGAISGVLGAYMILFPRSRILTLALLGFFVQFIRIPAVVFLVLWFVMQFLYGIATQASAESGGGVAWTAHVGGFLAGILLVFVFRNRERMIWYRNSSGT